MTAQETMTTITQKIDHATRIEEMTHLEDTTMTTETTQEIDTEIEDILTEVIAEKEKGTMRWTWIGRPAMATKGDIERVARSP